MKLKDTQLLRVDGGRVESGYPPNTETFSARPIESVSVRLETDDPLVTIHSPSHAVEVKRESER